jgi:hypothetical protein
LNVFHIDCELDYDVTQQTAFLLKVEVSATADQRVLAESLTRDPPLLTEQVNDGGLPNRLLRRNLDAARDRSGHAGPASTPESGSGIQLAA